MQYKDSEISDTWSRIELLNYQDILEDVLSSNNLFFNFEDPDVQKNFPTICDFMLHRYIPQRITNMSSDGYYSSFWDFLIDQFNYLNLFSNISECIQTFV